MTTKSDPLPLVIPEPDEFVLQFVRARGLFSAAIGYFGGGMDYSHVDAVMPDGTLIGARFDAIGGKPPGVWAREQGYEKWIVRDVMRIPSSVVNVRAGNAFLVRQIGMPYDPRAIEGFALGRWMHKPKSWICSGVQTARLVEGRKFSAPCEPYDSVSPNMLAFGCSVAGGRIDGAFSFP